ncbi:MAG: DUF4239 domain-containing protein [Agriterribacter sp.]
MTLVSFTNLTNVLPAWVGGVIFVTLVVGLSQAGLTLFNKWQKRIHVTPGNEVAGIMFGAISLIYSLILAFVIVAVWEDYEDLEKNIQAEADNMNSIITHTSTMPDSVRKPVYEALSTYCLRVTTNEWHMESDSLNNQSSAIPCLRLMLLTRKPDGDVQQRVFDVIDANLSQITELRRNRLTHNHSQIPGLVWIILQSGTIILIVFSYFFQVQSLRLKRIYLSFLSACLAMCLFLVSALDHPFNKYMQLSKTPYTEIQQFLQKDNTIICN